MLRSLMATKYREGKRADQDRGYNRGRISRGFGLRWEQRWTSGGPLGLVHGIAVLPVLPALPGLPGLREYKINSS